MKIILESTNKVVFFSIGGQDVPARIWEGHTAGGVPCHAFITRIAVREGFDEGQFDQELEEQPTPINADIMAYPLRMIL